VKVSSVIAPRTRRPRYALISPIAEGGMATVYLGKQRGDADFVRAVAIKRLRPQFSRSREFSASLLDEARLASRIHHPNVVPILDVVQSRGELLLIMEYVIGESFSRLIDESRARERPIDVDVAVAVILDVLRGLHAAHVACDAKGQRLGIVHRDVSPHNVLVGLDGVARVFDFGVAKALGNAQLTRPGQIKGTLAYMSPEQLCGNPVAAGSDVFAAAIVLWEALAGQDLFVRDDETATVGAVLAGPIPSLAELRAVPRSLDAVLARALNRDPAARHQSAIELAQELESCIRPASSTRVGDWVHSLVGPDLESRRTKLSVVETCTSPNHAIPEPPRELKPAAVEPSGSEPVPRSSKRRRGARRKSYGPAILLAVAIVAACAFALTWPWWSRHLPG
jgi:serine/threonine-protein kinase